MRAMVFEKTPSRGDETPNEAPAKQFSDRKGRLIGLIANLEERLGSNRTEQLGLKSQ